MIKRKFNVLYVVIILLLCLFLTGCGDSKTEMHIESGPIIVDSNTDLTYDNNGAFLMDVEDVFTLSDQGTTVTGKILRGTIHVGDKVQIVGFTNDIITTTVLDVQKFRESLDSAEMGETVGLVLSGISRNQVERGQVLAKPYSIGYGKKFDANITMLKPEEGGTEKTIKSNYRPQFYFRTTDVTGLLLLPDNIQQVIPGENTSVSIELISDIALEVGFEFDIREGGRVIGNGKITKIY